MQRILILLLLAVISYTTAAQRVNFRNYTVEDGLPQSDVLSMQQDKYGNVWFGTAEGLSRYNGQDFKNYTQEDGLAENYVVSSLKDTDGNFFVGHVTGGISYFDFEADSFSIFDPGPIKPGRVIKEFFRDRDGILWISSFGEGLFRYDANAEGDDRYIHLTDQDGLSSNFVFGIAQDANGIIWLATLAGVTLYDPSKSVSGKGAFRQLELNLPVTNMSAINIDEAGNIWLGSGRDRQTEGYYLIRLVPKGSDYTVTYLEYSHLADGAARVLHTDANGNLWVATNGGGAIFHETSGPLADESMKVFNEWNGIEYMAMRSIMEDREGNVWFGTQGGGVYQYTGELFITYQAEEGLKSNSIWSVLEDTKGHYWFGTASGVTRITFDEGISTFPTLVDLPRGIPELTTLDILEDQRGRIWFATVGGLYVKEGERVTEIDGEQLAFSYIRSLAEDSDGNIYVGTTRGINIISPDGKIEHMVVDDSLYTSNVYQLMIDRNDDLWVGTKTNGLDYIVDGTVTKFEGTEEYKTIYSILQDMNGNIWFSAEDAGLFMIEEYSDPDDRSIRNYTTENGLSSSNIYILVVDEANNIWAGTSKGVDKLNKETGKFQNYGKREGFLGMETNLNAAWRDSDSKIWFGTVNGVVKYDSDFDQQSTIEPITRVTGIKINNKEAAFPVDGIFDYSQNHLIFQYEGVSLTAPEKVRYRFMLEGFDEVYEQTVQTQVKYTNIPAGTYTFKVKARNQDGVWNEEPAVYTFTIDPPFYQTIWFYLICVVALVGLVYTFIRWRTSQIEAEKRILEGKVLERTEEINRQKEELAVKNKDITDSIMYARRIQEAILPPMDEIYESLPESFVLYMPKDIVSGDFYWFTRVDDKIVIAAADCTGHGVPGAFMSMIGHSLLNEIVNEKDIYEADKVLNALREGIIESLKQRGAEGESKDGMDISLCILDAKTRELQFAGANNPLYIIKNQQIDETKGDKQPIGIYYGQEAPFTNHRYTIEPGDTVYLFSDGYADQFGGERGKKFMYKRFKELLLDIQSLSMSKQHEKLQYAIEQWRGDLEQLDDILVIGFKVT